jgi:hypothetical protein
MRGLQVACLVLQIGNGIFAFITSQVQTNRILNDLRRFNVPALFILGGGLIAAVFGTFSILAVLKKGKKDIDVIKGAVVQKENLAIR